MGTGLRIPEGMVVMDTYYTTLKGERIDLACLSDTEQAFFWRCYAAYRANMPWGQFANLAERSENPVIAATDGWITSAVHAHPLYKAVRDLEDRLGLKQGKLAPDPGTDVTQEPLAEEALATAKAGDAIHR